MSESTVPTGTVPQSSVVLQVADELRRRIRDGLMVPGQRLVEIDLTRELGVSRGPLREALSRLAIEGLVVIEPYRGALVRKLSAGDLRDLYEVREVLEGQAAAMAARHIGEGDHEARLREAIDENATFETRDDVAAYLDFNERFHQLLAEISGNSLLVQLVDQLRTQAFRLQFRRMTPQSRRAAVAEHDEVAAAVLAGDEARAEAAMRDHVSRGGRVIQSLA